MWLRESECFFFFPEGTQLTRWKGGIWSQMNLQILVFYCEYRLHRLIHVAGRLSWVRNILDKISEWRWKYSLHKVYVVFIQAFSKLAAGHIGILGHRLHDIWRKALTEGHTWMDWCPTGSFQVADEGLELQFCSVGHLERWCSGQI